MATVWLMPPENETVGCRYLQFLREAGVFHVKFPGMQIEISNLNLKQ